MAEQSIDFAGALAEMITVLHRLAVAQAVPNGCSLSINIGTTEQKAPSNDSHSNMQHCWCCSGSAPLVALPGHSPQLYFARFESNRSVAPASLQTPTPRQQWPSLNPRASPLV